MTLGPGQGVCCAGACPFNQAQDEIPARLGPIQTNLGLDSVPTASWVEAWPGRAIGPSLVVHPRCSTYMCVLFGMCAPCHSEGDITHMMCLCYTSFGRPWSRLSAPITSDVRMMRPKLHRKLWRELEGGHSVAHGIAFSTRGNPALRRDLVGVALQGRLRKCHVSHPFAETCDGLPKYR